MATVATLSWNPNTDPDILRYYVSFGLYPGLYPSQVFTVHPTVTYVVDSVILQSDGLYYFTVSAEDTSGNISANATPVSKRIIRTASKLVVRR